jgi:hypothetical protein
VAHSALFSLFCDLALQDVPLADVDEYGCPMLWPLLLKYAERHCDKWNKYYQAKKRKGTAVPLARDPTDHRAPAADEKDFADAWQGLCGRLSAEERRVLEGRLRNETLAEIAAAIGRSQSTVSNILCRIRDLLKA